MSAREGSRVVPPSGLRVNREISVPVHVQLKTQIRHLITTGILMPGTQLPTVRQLAGFLRINPNTAAKALTELQQDGYVQSRRGSGTFVAEPPPDRERRMARTLEHVVDETLEHVHRLGYSVEEFLATAAARVPGAGARKVRRIRALLVECNWEELSRFSEELETELPLSVDRVLVEELPERIRRDPAFVCKFGVVITTFFHIHEVKRALGTESVPVVALLTETNISTLLRLSELPEGSTVGLICATAMGSQNLLRSLESAGLAHLKPILATADDPWSISRMLEATSIVVCSELAAEKIRALLPPAIEVIVDTRTLDRVGLDFLRDLLTSFDASRSQVVEATR